MKKILLLVTMTLGLAQLSMSEGNFVSSTDGIEPISSESFTTTANTDGELAVVAKKDKKGLGKLFSWVKAKVTKLAKKVAALGGLGHPVDKWFWFWIIGWGAGILLTALIPTLVLSGGISGASIGWLFLLLGSLAWLFGTVAFVVWLVKKLA
jgi:hypothetical protein